jgi:hypothetical protein
MRFLKAVRLDATDSQVHGTDGAASAGEWAVSGGYAVSGPVAGRRGPLTHHDNTFIGVASHGRCSLAEVCEIDAATYLDLIEGAHAALPQRSRRAVTGGGAHHRGGKMRLHRRFVRELQPQGVDYGQAQGNRRQRRRALLGLQAAHDWCS